MPFKYSDLVNKTKPGTLDVEGEEITFEFRPHLITPRFIHEFSALEASRMAKATPEQADATIMGISDLVARIVASWDVLDLDGKTPFPLDAERLASDFPVQIQIALLMACIQEMQPGEATAPEKTRASTPATK